ncbi:MAG: AmmeMemoRadiSam system radical SAM enzyme [Elusimicrobiota bacterium]
MKEAMYYEKLKDKKVKCNLCPRSCVLSDGQTGFCRARQNIGGTLYTLNYGRVVAMNVDPIEKKPFFHVLPGSKSFSIACAGCNLRCKYCQNWQISQRSPDETEYEEYSPEKLVELALKSGSKSIAYTYSEPVVFYEYMIDTAKIARSKGLKNIVVTAGFINKEPLENLLKYIDAIKVDLKGFNKNFYLKYTSGGIEPILESLRTIKKSGKWLEIVNLVIPGANDNEEDIKGLCNWIKENLGTDVPVHFTRFYPNYKMMDTPPTPLETLVKARDIAKKIGLKYVYTGNINYSEGETTYCKDGSIAIERKGFFVIKNNLKDGRCPSGDKIPGVWK